MEKEGDLLAVRGDVHRRSGGDGDVVFLLLVVVAVDGDRNFPGLSSFRQDKQVAVVGEGEGAVLRGGEVTDRILVVMGELDGLSGFGEGTLIDIRGFSVALAEVVEGVAVGGENRVAVLAFVGAEFREGALRIDGEGSGRGRDKFPDIPRDRGGMVLAERVLIALVVFVEDGPVRIDGQGLEGHRGDQARRLARQVGRIQLRRTGETVEAAAHQGAVVSAEEYSAVREDGQRGLIAGQGSDLPGLSAFRPIFVYVAAL